MIVSLRCNILHPKKDDKNFLINVARIDNSEAHWLAATAANCPRCRFWRQNRASCVRRNPSRRAPRGWVRLHEKGSKVNELPCHHNLEQFLDEWLSRSGLSAEPAAPLFPTMRHGRLTKMILRSAIAAGIATKISAHSFRATRYHDLQNGGRLEVAQQMAGNESARTTGLCDRRNDSVALDEVERVVY